MNMLRQEEAIEETFREMERIIGNLVECYALPHTKMCMRWSKPTVAAYREEVVGWLEDYGKSFRRLPKKGLPGRADLPTFARAKLEEEMVRIRDGAHPLVERAYKNLFQ